MYFPSDRALPYVAKFDARPMATYTHVPTREVNLHIRMRRRGVQSFAVFLRHHTSLQENISFIGIDRNIQWAGDAIILKIGKRKPYVNLVSKSDKVLAALAIKR